MEREQQQAVARQEVMVEELRKAELVRDRLESLEQSEGLPGRPRYACANRGASHKAGAPSS